jgi:hypothetical protein
MFKKIFSNVSTVDPTGWGAVIGSLKSLKFCILKRIKIERRWGRAPGVRGYRAGSSARRGPGAPRATFQSTSGAPSARSRVCTAHARRSRAQFPAARPPNASPAARPHGSGARGLRGPHSAARLGARFNDLIARVRDKVAAAECLRAFLKCEIAQIGLCARAPAAPVRRVQFGQ